MIKVDQVSEGFDICMQLTSPDQLKLHGIC